MSADALALAVRYTRTRVRSAHEAVTHLHRRGIPLGAAQRAVARTQALGLVDDRACARLWAEHWARQGYASEAIRKKLFVKGLAMAVVEGALASLGADDLARARWLIASRRPRGRFTPARLSRWLAGRGFDEETIEHVLSYAEEP
ncbi:MAG: regulatory protein RecX [Candidatus Omnitrophica bacterium]|nr:regulatory protein RecX [Candidatus Omnitrophota bacterium]